MAKFKSFSTISSLTAICLIQFTWSGVVARSATTWNGDDKAVANSAIQPVAREEPTWKARHDAINASVAKGDAELIFIGDSITQGWEGAGKEIWQTRYASYKAVNVGISGDRTQHVLWRLDHGNLDHIHPKAAVIMIGTNNSNGNDNTAEEIAEGIKAITTKIQEKLPATKILLLGIFPRGERPNPQREKIDRVNQIISKLDDQKSVHFLDIGSKFKDKEGVISKEVMPDFLHLSSKGYEIWADSIDDALKSLMK